MKFWDPNIFKIPEICVNFYHDNTPSHKVIVVQEFLTNNATKTIEQKLVSNKNDLSSEAKITTSKKSFGSIELTQENSLRKLETTYQYLSDHFKQSTKKIWRIGSNVVEIYWTI